MDNRVLVDPTASTIKSVFANFSPKWAGFLRGLLVAIVMAVLQAIIAFIQGHSVPGTTEATSGAIVTLVMWVLGIIDAKRTAA